MKILLPKRKLLSFCLLLTLTSASLAQARSDSRAVENEDSQQINQDDLSQWQHSLGAYAEQSLVGSHDIQVRLNDDLNGVTSKLIPYIAGKEGYEEISIADQTLATFSWGLNRCYKNKKWKVRLEDTKLDLPFESNTIEADVRSSGRVNTDVDMPGFDFQLALRLKKHPDTSKSGCENKPVKVYTLVDFGASGFSGEFDVSVASVGNTIRVNAIKKFALEVDHVGFAKRSTNALLNYAIGLFSNVIGCSSLTNCANYLIDELVENNNTVKNNIKKAINGAIEHPLKVEGGNSVQGVTINYGIGLANLHTSRSSDRLTTTWEVNVETDEPNAACAEHLVMPSFSPSTPGSTDNDIDVEIPFALIADLVYFSGKTGHLCKNVRTTSGDEFEIRPHGEFSVESGSSTGAQDAIIVRVPFIATGSVVAAASATTVIQGDIKITTLIASNCDGGVELDVDSVEFTDLSGEIDLGGPFGTIDATNFIDLYATQVENSINARLPSVTILPQMFDRSELTSRYLRLDDVEVSSTSVRAGFKIMSGTPSECLTDSDDDSGTGTGGGSGGGWSPGDPIPRDLKLGDPRDDDGDETDDLPGTGPAIAEVEGAEI